jgi:hypothetical protein
VVDHDAVLVVEHLGEVAELDRPADAAFHYRPFSAVAEV